MTKKEVMDYVTETPQNVNKNILGQKLDEFQKNVSWNDLKDKPFYSETGKIAIFENQNAVGDDYSVIEIDPLHLAKLKVGDFIEIVYNGVSYLTVLNHPREDSSSAAYEIGNPFLIGASEDYDTGEPFYAGIASEAIFHIFCAEDAIVSAYLNVETVHKLDAKYLPDNADGSYDLILEGAYAEGVDLVKGDFMSAMQKFSNRKAPRILFRLISNAAVCESTLCGISYYDGTICIGVLYLDYTEVMPCFARYTLTEDNAFRCVTYETLSFA